MLTHGTGLAERVQVIGGDALALLFAKDTFDLAWSQAVSQNIAEKGRFVSELARVVRPGGHIALFELVAGPGGSLEFPVPWADQENQSWLVTAEELRELLDSEPGLTEPCRRRPPAGSLMPPPCSFSDAGPSPLCVRP